MSDFVIQEATLVETKSRVALDGPAGSGKTFSALLLAQGIGGKTVVICTERGSAAKYAKKWLPWKYHVLTLKKPYTPERYIQAINFCEEQGYDIIIVDSLSHAWAGEGGALEMVDDAKISSGGNTYYAWRNVTPWHNKLVDAMLNSSAHIIATLRTKVEYAEQKQGGRTTYEKVGTVPIQREGLDYEFDVVMDLDIDHNAVVSKTRLDEIDGKVFKPLTSDVGTTIAEWVTTGEVSAPVVVEAPPTQQDLLSFGKALSLETAQIKDALDGAGFDLSGGFDPAQYDEMKDTLAGYALTLQG